MTFTFGKIVTNKKFLSIVSIRGVIVYTYIRMLEKFLRKIRMRGYLVKTYLLG